MQQNQQVNFAIISIYSFPYGLAPTSRTLAYSKGLIENNARVSIYLPFPTDNYNSKQNLENNGSFNSIEYLYTSGRYKSKSKLFRAISVLSGYRKIWGYITCWIKIIKNNKKLNIDFLIISSDYIPNLFIFGLLAKRINAKSIFIFDEYPVPIRHKLKNKIPIWKENLYKIVLKLIDGYISISEKLKIYFCDFVPKKTLVLSTITDISRFKNTNTTISEKISYICYMGNMELTKDNVDNIINAFSLITNKYPDLELHLYGRPNTKTLEILKKQVKELNLEDKVLFKGKVNYQHVPTVLKNAKILVSSQPNTLRASGGFPTKLGEYLAAGVPTLITDVGENSKYVKDKIHLYFSMPDNPEDFANNIEYILNNYSSALSVAKNGKNFIIDNYSHFKQGEIILQFCKTL